MITSVTVQAWPKFNFLTAEVNIKSLAGNPAFYKAMGYLFSQFPILSSLGLTCYNDVIGNSSINGTDYSSFIGIFMLPVLSPENTTSSLSAALRPLLTHISSKYSDQLSITISNVDTFSTFYEWWFENTGPNYAGIELIVGSRLLGSEALRNTSALETALKGVISHKYAQSLNFYLLGGKGIADTKPRGGSNAVNPAWRKALVHAGSDSFYFFLDFF